MIYGMCPEEKKIMMDLQQHELNIVKSRKGTFSLSFF